MFAHKYFQEKIALIVFNFIGYTSSKMVEYRITSLNSHTG